MDHILCQISWIYLKKHGENFDKPSVKIYVNKMENRIIFKIKDGQNLENRITFKIKNWQSLERVTPKTMKLLGSTENKITKDRNVENVPHLVITEVVLVHCNIVSNDYQ